MGLFGGGGSSSSTESGSSTTTTNSSAGSDAGKKQLESILGQLQDLFSSSGAGYTKEDAVADSQQASEYALTKVLRTGVGTVNKSSTAGGAYNNTTQDLLSNNLAAEASAAGAEVTQNTINSYAQISQNQQSLALQSLLSALGLDQAGTQSSTQVQDYTKKTTTPKSGSGIFSSLAGIAGGVIGAIYGGPAGAAVGSKLGSTVGGAITDK